MYAFGDLDDAVSVVDVWLHEHPEVPPWEREESTLPVSWDAYREPWQCRNIPMEATIAEE